MLCADENFFPWIDICAIQINKIIIINYDRVKQIFNKSKALGILLVEIYKRAAKIVIWVCERAQKG